MLGVSPVVWLILGGLVAIRLFMCTCDVSRPRDGEPLVTPSLFRQPSDDGGLMMFFFQYVVMMGLFFVIPLYLSVALGLSAIDTGIKIDTAVGVDAARRGRHPEVLPVDLAAARRRAVGRGRGDRASWCSSRDGRGRERVDRDGAAAPDRPRDGWPRLAARERHRLGRPRRGEPRGRRSPEHGDAVRRVARHGAGRLGPDRLADGLVPDRDRREPRRAARRSSSQANVELASGVPFISDAQLETAIGGGGRRHRRPPRRSSRRTRQARIDGLRSSLALLAILGVIALFFTKRIPRKQPAAAAVAEPS